ncbi:MAG: Uma2 family endonuclease [Nostoc sp. ChiQUE02]|uniref:Uma2 family endonuclease n=1 Tax=Nostoc sp. ChiQUE02 TaxID=3075377 RepID=UPI002AD43AC6|nr:Uma2 family endonuclease [Nostoc sp. ChiQUE02]MDZ8230640.1 Uma2 family endonuclease [Nostoc sp. ChiQUE02]
MILQAAPSTQNLIITWEKLPDDFVLPDDPVENIQQPFLAAALTDALGEAGLITSEMLIASNFGLVANVNQKTVIKAPDWLFVSKVFPVPQGTVRRSYTPNLEGEPVAIVMEFLSETDTGEYSVRPTYPYGKLYYYEHILKIPVYGIFDPASTLLEVRRLEAGQYVLQQPNAQGQYPIPELNLSLGIWYGKQLGITTNWLRWWDEAGNLLLWSAEKVEQERQRAEVAEQELERLRSLLQQQKPQ